MEQQKLIISTSPHVRGRDNVQKIMLRVILALLPAWGAGLYYFGLSALYVTLCSVGSCLFFEWLYRRIMHKNNSLGDLSAVVTGLLLAMILSPAVPLWLCVLGAFFAIVVVKHLYGGLGKNFLNPALAARCFLFSWAGKMISWPAPRGVDAISSATPLAAMKELRLPAESLMDCFLGFQRGCIGECCALALLLGGIYLLCTNVIKPHIPLSYLLTVAVLTFLFPRGNPRLLWMGYQLLSGGLMLGAIFMATDYVTSPTTARGRIIYGMGCGLLTVLIRYFGSYTECVSYSILIMNLFSSALDKWTRPRVFGHKKEVKA